MTERETKQFLALAFALGLMVMCFILGGCGHVRHIEAFPQPFPIEVLPEPQTVPDKRGDCPDAIAMQRGVEAPCGGVLVPSAKLGKLIEGYELYGQAQLAYIVMAEGRQVDRNESQQIIDATEKLTSEARANQGRFLLVGVGIGGGIVGGFVAVIAAALR